LSQFHASSCKVTALVLRCATKARMVSSSWSRSASVVNSAQSMATIEKLSSSNPPQTRL